MLYKIITASALFFYLTGCSSLPVFQVTSLENEKEYYMGREIVTKQEGDVKTILNYEEQVSRDFVFNLAVYNNSAAKVTIDPAMIYMEVLEENSEALPPEEIKKSSALNPEIQINLINKKIEETAANKQTSEGLNLFMDAADLAVHISEIGKEKSVEELEDDAAWHQNEAVRRESGNQDYINRMSGLDENKRYWMNDVLRITTLYPGEDIGGAVCIPWLKKATMFRLVIPVNGINYTFLYKQEKVSRFKN